MTDCAVFDSDGHVLLVRRKHNPFAGCHALPSGFVEIGETVEAACLRELLEETGLEVSGVTLVGVYSDPKRDPRGHTVSVAYLTLLPAPLAPHAGSDAMSAEWIKDWRSLRLAFDHAQILAEAEQIVRRQREFSPVLLAQAD